MGLKIFISVIAFLSAMVVQAQTIYRTTEGHIILIGEQKDQKIIAESHKLFILLDYKTMEVSGTLDLKTLVTGVEYLEKRLKDIEAERSQITFSGTIPIDNFIDQPHLPVSFNWPVKLMIDNKSYEISLKGTLTHFNGGKAIACMLGASGDLSSDMIGLKKMYPELSDVVKVQFTQTILRKNEQ